jgi:hypothetical protein
MMRLSMQARLSLLDTRMQFDECPRCHKTAAMTGLAVCYECSLEAAGHPRTQQHHVHLRKIDSNTVAEIPANLHQMLTLRSGVRYPVLKEPSMDVKVKSAQALTDAAELLEVIGSYPFVADDLAATRELARIIARRCRESRNDLLREEDRQ